MLTISIIKPEVAGTMMMTQQWSSQDAIEKSCISHFYVFVSSSDGVDGIHGSTSSGTWLDKARSCHVTSPS